MLSETTLRRKCVVTSCCPFAKHSHAFTSVEECTRVSLLCLGENLIATLEFIYLGLAWVVVTFLYCVDRVVPLRNNVGELEFLRTSYTSGASSWKIFS